MKYMEGSTMKGWKNTQYFTMSLLQIIYNFKATLIKYKKDSKNCIRASVQEHILGRFERSYRAAAGKQHKVVLTEMMCCRCTSKRINETG